MWGVIDRGWGVTVTRASRDNLPSHCYTENEMFHLFFFLLSFFLLVDVVVGKVVIVGSRFFNQSFPLSHTHTSVMSFHHQAS